MKKVIIPLLAIVLLAGCVPANQIQISNGGTVTPETTVTKAEDVSQAEQGQEMVIEGEMIKFFEDYVSPSGIVYIDSQPLLTDSVLYKCYLDLSKIDQISYGGSIKVKGVYSTEHYLLGNNTLKEIVLMNCEII